MLHQFPHLSIRLNLLRACHPLFRTLLSIVCLFNALSVVTAADSKHTFDHKHLLWGNVLKNYTQDGKVAYGELKKHPQDLDLYLKKISLVTQKEFDEWTSDQQLALLINLYNAQTFRLILDYHPITSIRKIGFLPGAPWKKKIVQLFGKIIDLNTLEHEIIRKNYKEPAVHFALVCAALGCPPLRSEPFTAEKLKDQLHDQGVQFLSQTAKNQIDLPTKTLNLSHIFDWYEGDFVEHSGSVVAYILPYLPEDTAQALRPIQSSVKIVYTEYDWSLNEK